MKYYVALKGITKTEIVVFDTREQMIKFCDDMKSVGREIICVWTEGGQS